MMEFNANTSKINDTYQFIVNNKKEGKISEVGTIYNAVVTLPEEAVQYVETIKIDDKTGEVNGNVYTFSKLGTLPAGEEKENQHVISITVDANDILNFEGNTTDLNGTVIYDGITIQVIAQQID